MSGESPLPRLDLRFFGTPRVIVDGDLVATDRRKAIALLAYLAVTAKSQPREKLAALLWPEYEAASALAYLRRTLWEIRKMIGGGWIAADRHQITLVSDPMLTIDVIEFRQTIAEGIRHNDTRSIQNATELYTGEFLAGFSLQDAAEFDDWQGFQSRILRDELGSAFSILAERAGQEGDWDGALTYAMRWLDLDSLHEPIHRLMMRTLTRAGQRSAALRHYQDLVDLLDRELGAAPEPETIALYDRIRKGELTASTGDNGSAPDRHKEASSEAMESSPPGPGNLPAPATRFVGRASELRKISDQLLDANCRIMTLIGPGGIGKSRLAIKVATQMSDAFSDGVFFVPLVALNTPDEIVPAIAKAIGFSFYGEDAQPHRQLVDYLRPKRALLILDNFEHLLDGDVTAADLCSELVVNAPYLKLIITSRILLRMRGETVFEVNGLEVPPPSAHVTQPWDESSAAAVQLFIQSTRQAYVDFAPNLADNANITEICRLVEGMPLAIELAAGWTGILSLDEIRTELSRGMDILTTDLLNVPARQRSMAAVFDSTWRLLTTQEQDAFMDLSIFRSDFGRVAAQQIAGVSISLLQALINKSLLRRASIGRFEIHELLRQYAFSKLQADLARWGRVRDRYITYYFGMLEDGGSEIIGPRQRQAFDRLAQDRTNIRNAWLWALADGRLDEAHRLFYPLIDYLNARETRHQGETLLAAAQNLVEGDTSFIADGLQIEIMALRAWFMRFEWTSPEPIDLARKALMRLNETTWGDNLGIIWSILGMLFDIREVDEDTLAMLERGVAVTRRQGDSWRLAQALNALGSCHIWRRNYDLAHASLEESLTICRSIGDHWQMASNLMSLSLLEVQLGHHDRAIALAQESQRLFTQAGDEAAVAEGLFELGMMYLNQGSFTTAEQHFHEAFRLIDAVGDQLRAADALSWAAIAARESGDYEHSLALRQQVYALYTELDYDFGLSWTLWELAELYRQLGDQESAEHYLARSHVLFRQHKITRGEAYFHRTLGKIRLTEGRWDAARQEFEQSLELCIASHYDWGTAYAQNGLAQTHVLAGNIRSAWPLLKNAMELSIAWPSPCLAMAVATTCALTLSFEQPADAIELLAAILAQRSVWGETRQQAEALLQQLQAESPSSHISGVRQQDVVYGYKDVITMVQGLIDI